MFYSNAKSQDSISLCSTYFSNREIFMNYNTDEIILKIKSIKIPPSTISLSSFRIESMRQYIDSFRNDLEILNTNESNRDISLIDKEKHKQFVQKYTIIMNECKNKMSEHLNRHSSRTVEVYVVTYRDDKCFEKINDFEYHEMQDRLNFYKVKINIVNNNISYEKITHETFVSQVNEDCQYEYKKNMRPLIYIHGFNNSFIDTIIDSAKLIGNKKLEQEKLLINNSLSLEGPIILISWPSYRKIIPYSIKNDYIEQNTSIEIDNNIYNNIKNEVFVIFSSVDIIAHSLGNKVLYNIFSGNLNKYIERINIIILSAPCIKEHNLKNLISDISGDNINKIYKIWSGSDRALNEITINNIGDYNIYSGMTKSVYLSNENQYEVKRFDLTDVPRHSHLWNKNVVEYINSIIRN